MATDLQARLREAADIEEKWGVQDYYHEDILREAADRIDQLEAAIRDYLREYDNPAPDYAFRHHQRERMRAALNGSKADG